MTTAPDSKNRILVVEDDSSIRRLMTTHFRKLGYEVDYAMTAEEVASDEPYDVVVTDVHLPGESGVDLARRIRQAHPRQQVVFMTGDHDASLARQAMDSGAAGYLLKPFEFFELDAVVKHAIDEKRYAPATSFEPHRHVTTPPRVVFSPQRRKRTMRPLLRVAAAVGAMLTVAFGVGSLLQPKPVIETSSVGSVQESGRQIVVPVVLDRSVYISQAAAQ